MQMQISPPNLKSVLSGEVCPILGIFDYMSGSRDKDNILMSCVGRCGVAKKFSEFDSDSIGGCISFPNDLLVGCGKGWHCFCSIDCLKKEIISWRKHSQNDRYRIGEHDYERDAFEFIREKGSKGDIVWLGKYTDMIKLFQQ